MKFGDHLITDDEIVAQTDHFIFLVTPQQILQHSGIIIPKRFVSTPFDLNSDEWIDLQAVLQGAKEWINSQCKPDGFNIGWNVGTVAGQEVDHLHLHVIPRFEDEPMAGKGIRAHIKQDSNKRPAN